MIWYNIEDKGEIMKSDHLKESKNIEDRRGQSGGSYSSGRSGGNLGGGILQILLFAWKF